MNESYALEDESATPMTATWLQPTNESFSGLKKEVPPTSKTAALDIVRGATTALRRAAAALASRRLADNGAAVPSEGGGNELWHDAIPPPEVGGLRQHSGTTILSFLRAGARPQTQTARATTQQTRPTTWTERPIDAPWEAPSLGAASEMSPVLSQDMETLLRDI